MKTASSFPRRKHGIRARMASGAQASGRPTVSVTFASDRRVYRWLTERGSARLIKH